LSKLEKFEVDCLVIGGGISGIAIARELSSKFDNIFLIERNLHIAQETSSRNSEVIHAGMYYDHGSLKSKLCLKGKELLYKYLEERKIDFNRCGKYILSSNDEESENLNSIYENGLTCGVDDLTYDNSLRSKYPFLHYKEAIFSPSTGIFDSHSFIHSLSRDFQSLGGNILLGNEILNVEQSSKGYEVLIEDKNIENQFVVITNILVNSAGLNAVHIAGLIDEGNTYQEEFVKGEYYIYQGKERLENLIYPTPSENSLGLHATIDLGKGIRFGPSAYVVDEIDYSLSSHQKSDFLSAVQSYWPSIQAEDLTPGYSGIRPKLKGIKDFIIDSGTVNDNQYVNVLGYASPGLTSSLALGIEVSNLIE
jgi:L-2-hydroxyglutarate oxidase LhgO